MPDPLAPASQGLRLQVYCHSRLCWKLNSRPYACQAITLAIELHPALKESLSGNYYTI